jgi:hypothetical protein
VSTPGDCAKIALWNTFEKSRKVKDFTIATSERLKSVQKTSVVIGVYATEN